MFDDEIEIIDKPKMGRRNIGKMQDRGNPPPNDVKQQFDFAIAVARINTGRVQSPEELEDRFNQLFDIAHEKGIIPTYEHLVLVSGLPKSTYYDYGNENYEHTPNPKFSDTIKKAKSIISACEARFSQIWQDTSASLYLPRKELWWTS